MDIDLGQLRVMHPRLPGDLALIIVARAALGLQRHGHASAVPLAVELERIASRASLAWPTSDLAVINQHDENRVTEDGAEAIVLALAHRSRGWRVLRRMQREEHADWLLEDRSQHRRRLVAVEVSGVDRGSLKRRLTEKLEQVAQSTDVDDRWAGIIGFQSPSAALRSTPQRLP